MSGAPKSQSDSSELSEAEIAKRRDEVIRRMLNTPPTPKPVKAEPTVRRMAQTKPAIKIDRSTTSKRKLASDQK